MIVHFKMYRIESWVSIDVPKVLSGKTDLPWQEK